MYFLSGCEPLRATFIGIKSDCLRPHSGIPWDSRFGLNRVDLLFALLASLTRPMRLTAMLALLCCAWLWKPSLSTLPDIAADTTCSVGESEFLGIRE